MKWKQVILLSAPLSLAAFLIVTARAVVAMVDGPAEMLYGFPLFWIKPGPTSLSVIIDVAAVIVDLVCYQLVIGLVTVVVVRRWPRLGSSVATRMGAWIICIVIVAGCVIVLAGDAGRGGVTFDSAFRWRNVQRYSLYFGVPGRR
jgi:hypothetical protein